MSSTMEHFSHPKHPLELKENDVIGEDARCCVCGEAVVGYPTYTCTSHDTDCEGFYLHKSCAELAPRINHHTHNKHPLALLLRPDDNICGVCERHVIFAYACDDCEIDVCVFCASEASEQRMLRHEGHTEHTLTLLQREAFFKCDACGEKATGSSSYMCIICEFWIHKRCAFAPLSIPAPAYHHHPLTLVYSIPYIHRYFSRHCAVCDKRVHVTEWMYYCHRCTYFVHMKCATSSNTIAMLYEIEVDDIHDEADLAQFPLCNEDSIFDLILTQCGKLQGDYQGKGENNITRSSVPHMIEEHWSHKIHPLELLQFTISDNDNDDNNDDRRTLICDGCIQPITVSHPCYYACIQCRFFLHSFCATKLPIELPAGASPFHPQHPLLLRKRDIFYDFVECGVCCYSTNGFYYHCEPCDVKIEIRCVFLPLRIKHKSHKLHSLIQRPYSNSMCILSKLWIFRGVEYACQTCSGFQIHLDCVFYPSRMKYKYDSHPVTLRYPPFFYEGVFYCEICEEQVNNRLLLYHCGKCDHSFHHGCLHSHQSIKLGGTIEISINDQPHTLALVLKRTLRKNSPKYYFCKFCLCSYRYYRFFECNGCGFLACRDCVTKNLGRLTSHYIC